MSTAESMLPEYDQEMATTRETVSRVPDGKYDWKPHAKSGSLGWLVSHLVEIPGWINYTVEHDELDIAPVGAEPYKSTEHTSTAAALAAFDEAVARGRAALAGCSDEAMMVTWSLKGGGETLFAMPRVACLRSFVMNHLIHHRAQLGVYLRLLDVPVPQTYGPSADETGM